MSAGRVFSVDDPTDIAQVGQDAATSFVDVPVSVPDTIDVPDGLIGVPDEVIQQTLAAIKAGKSHLIFYGPPGTGKTTLAIHVARALDSSTLAPMALTASSAWTSQDLIGGYQPIGGGQIQFVPGILLQHFWRPTVIDELNRAPIDKVLGPLFSVLAGDSTQLQYRVNPSEPSSAFYEIHGYSAVSQAPNRFQAGPNWRLICTMNTIDRSSLGQFSYALARRFAWIEVPTPNDLFSTTSQILHSINLTSFPISDSDANPVAAVWKAVNAERPVGAAPVIDFAKYIHHMAGGDEVFKSSPTGDRAETYASAFRMAFVPLLHGISRTSASSLVKALAQVFAMNDSDRSSLIDEIAGSSIL